MKAVVDVMVLVRVDREGQEPIYVPTEVQVEGEVQVVSIDRVTQTGFKQPVDGKFNFSLEERDVKPFLSKEALEQAYEEFSRKIERSLPHRPEKMARSS